MPEQDRHPCLGRALSGNPGWRPAGDRFPSGVIGPEVCVKRSEPDIENVHEGGGSPFELAAERRFVAVPPCPRKE